MSEPKTTLCFRYERGEVIEEKTSEGEPSGEFTTVMQVTDEKVKLVRTVLSRHGTLVRTSEGKNSRGRWVPRTSIPKKYLPTERVMLLHPIQVG